MSGLFSTLILEKSHADKLSLDELEATIWMLAEEDTAGQEWCEREGYDGYTSYASLDDLPSRAPIFAELVMLLDTQAAEFAQQLHWDLSDGKLILDSLWVNVLGEGGSHSGHIHPNSVISGTIYVAMPDGAGAIKFEDPRLPMMMGAPPLQNDAPDDRSRFVYRSPKPGTALMWESWLRHEVMINRSEEPRLSVSFNYSF